MIVTNSNLEQVIEEIAAHERFGFDTETTGLKWSDELFAISIATPVNTYYFDFRYLDKRPNLVQLMFIQEHQVYYSANAKFDINMLVKFGVIPMGQAKCLIVRERVIKNNKMPQEYSLDGLAKAYGFLPKVGLKPPTTREIVPGKKGLVSVPHYDKIPLNEIAPYAEHDAWLHLNIGLAQEKLLVGLEPQYPRTSHHGSIGDVLINEDKLLPVCQKMEEAGIKLDVDYTQEGLDYEIRLIDEGRFKFADTTGKVFEDSPLLFAEIFKEYGLDPGRTPKGNPSYADDVLEAVNDHPVIKLIQDIRYRTKRVNTYYSSFLYQKDKNDLIHASINQAGTETGRMSYSNPNLQNVPKEDEAPFEEFSIRKCFIPREDYCFVSIDFQQQEFRLFIDYAGEKKLIARVIDGEDVHEATAQELGIKRKQAKTINFGLIYGMGIEKLAKALGVSKEEARDLKDRYFSKFRGVGNLSRQIRTCGLQKGYIQNWFGRVCHIKDRSKSYILLNHLIQGGCSDMAKIAMIQCASYLEPMKSRLLLQVHDELLFEIHKDELSVVQYLAGVMESVYKSKFSDLTMKVSIDHSWTSWGFQDKIKGDPCATGKLVEIKMA